MWMLKSYGNTAYNNSHSFFFIVLRVFDYFTLLISYLFFYITIIQCLSPCFVGDAIQIFLPQLINIYIWCKYKRGAPPLKYALIRSRSMVFVGWLWVNWVCQQKPYWFVTRAARHSPYFSCSSWSTKPKFGFQDKLSLTENTLKNINITQNTYCRRVW